MRPRLASTSFVTSYLLLEKGVYASRVPPPTRVEVADPVPALEPHPDSSTAPDSSASSNPEFDYLSSAKVLPPGSQLPYDGAEYRLGPLRIRPGELQMEGIMIALLSIYFLSTIFIRTRNKSKASTWFQANERILKGEFAGVGFGVKELFRGDGGDEFLTYVTGRRAIESGWIKINMGGYDLMTRLYNEIRPVLDTNFDSGSDRIVLDFKLTPPVGTPNTKMCFAILRREQLKKLRDLRWDLRTFTKLSEALPISPELIVMTESGDITKALLLDQVTGLKEALQDGAEGMEYFESLVISDMPAEEPDSTNPALPTDEFHLVLTLRLPPTSQAASTAPLITLACNIADVIYKKEKLLPEVAIMKAKKRRSDVLEVLLKSSKAELARIESKTKADALVAKRKLEREKEDKKLSSMTPGERMKWKAKEEEKERKKKIMKVQKGRK